MALHSAKVTLAADNTAQRAVATTTAKCRNALWIKIYAESGNTVDGTNGVARYGDSTVTWVAASCKGIPILPGLHDEIPPAGSAGALDVSDLWFSGKQNDVFQVVWATL